MKRTTQIMLVLEIEYLAGVAFAAIGPDSNQPDWPPQPDRIFSALVATWAAHGRDGDEAEALEWLEALPPPVIQASPAFPRTAPDVFVPPNDPRSDRQKHARGVIPAFRSRQPRRFPAARPDDPVVRLYWDEAALSEATFAVLQRLARDTAYVGHSASLARCWFRREGDGDGSARLQAIPAERSVYAGRLKELRRRFGAGQRPSPGSPVAPPAPAAETRTNLFSDRWLILEHVGGDMPDVRASGIVARAIRDALLSGYKQVGLENAIPESVSGHAPDGSPSRAPHLAVVPLPFAGFPYADGHVMGFAVVPPGGGDLLDDDAFRRAVRTIAPWDGDQGRRIMTVRFGAGASPDAPVVIRLSPTLNPSEGRRSLDPSLYTGRARTVATLTPIVLDRHVKQRGPARAEEIRAQMVAACRNIGLPEPEAVSIAKHSAFEGAASAYPSTGAPKWMRWRLPPSLASRQLAHAVIRFPLEVEGPVILGAGRFIGLGLCRPLDPASR